MYKFIFPDAYLQRYLNQEEDLSTLNNAGPIGHNDDEPINQAEIKNLMHTEENPDELIVQWLDLNQIVKEYLDSPTKYDPNRHCFACGTRNWKQYSNSDGIFCGTCHP